MNQNDFFEAMRTLDSETVLHAMEHKKRKSGRGALTGKVLAACLLLIAGIIWGPTAIKAAGSLLDAPEEHPRVKAKIDSFVFDAYSVLDYEVPWNYSEITEDLYILGVKCESPIYQQAVTYVKELLSDRENGFSTFYNLSGVDTSLGVICLHFTGTYEGEEMTVDDGLGGKGILSGVSQNTYPLMFFPNIINGQLRSILCVEGDRKNGFCAAHNLVCAGIFDAKYDKQEGIDKWREEKRNSEEFYIWQALSAFTSPEKPLIPINKYVTNLPGGGFYNIIGDTAYRTGSWVSVYQDKDKAVNRTPSIDFDFYQKMGLEFEVKCWHIGG